MQSAEPPSPLPHAPGIPIEVHGHPNLETLLLWHPAASEQGTEDAARLSALAKRIASRGRRVVVPRWSDGRDLLRSVRFARETAVHPPDQLTIVGYGVGGIAALGLTLHQRRLGIGVTRATCVDAVPGTTDPISGQPLPDPPPAATALTEVDLVVPDDTEGAAWTRATATSWADQGWVTTVVEPDQFTWRL